MGQPAPTHPLISILNYGNARFDPRDFQHGLILNFYKISFKTSFSGRLKYGQGYYDFEEGGMSFIAPRQLLLMQDEDSNYEGMTLHIRHSTCQKKKRLRSLAFMNLSVSVSKS